MAQDVEGQWPWETGDMPVAKKPKPQDVGEPDIPMYTLPTVPARKGEDADPNGRRPMTAREQVRAIRERQESGGSYFNWR